MKKAIVLMVLVMSFSGCGLLTELKHVQSNIIGLNRTVTLYSASGEVLGSWTGTFQVEDNGGSINFVNHGKTIKIAGTYTVIEN